MLLLAGGIALFFLLTNGVLAVQAGWIHELGKKGRYVRLMGISVSVFAVLMSFALKVLVAYSRDHDIEAALILQELPP